MIEDIPIETLPIPWNEVLAEIQGREYCFPYPLRKTPPTSEEKARASIKIFQWEIALHFVVRSEWDSKHKIPYPKSVRQPLEPRGRLLIQWLKLCERCHTFQEAYGERVPYKHAGFWFGAIFWEQILLDLYPLFVEQNTCVYNSNVKEAELSVERSRLAQMKKGKNPFEDEPIASATSLLVKFALHLSDASDQFFSRYWRPFLKQQSAHIEEMKSPRWGRTFAQKGRLYAQAGRGKSTVSLAPLELYEKLYR